MSKGEIEILTAILFNKHTRRQLTTGRLTRYSPSIALTLETLKKKNYIVEHETKGYMITEKGFKILLILCPEQAALYEKMYNRSSDRQLAAASKAIKMIEQLGIEYNIKISVPRKIDQIN